jgi:UPF0755 protein
VLILAAACGGSPGGTPERVVVPKGASFRQITDSLVAHDIVTHRTWFTLLARIRRMDREVKAGTYEFTTGSSAWQVLNVLREGRVLTLRFTVPEGLTLKDIAELATAELQTDPDSFSTAARDPEVTGVLGIAAPSAEGFLLPDTYQFPVDVTARQVVGAMVEAFLRAWKPEWTARLDSLHMTRREVVTLASIVEGEAIYDSERPVIAGVYHNRLRIGMALQADPTVQYAIQQKTGERKDRLFVRDYRTPSPYNTYLNPGLPPGPIASPGLASIEAALYPEKVPYLYFVATGNGRHNFSRTYQEHLTAIARARAMRSAPPPEIPDSAVPDSMEMK